MVFIRKVMERIHGEKTKIMMINRTSTFYGSKDNENFKISRDPKFTTIDQHWDLMFCTNVLK